jgi:hypothetical protein
LHLHCANRILLYAAPALTHTSRKDHAVAAAIITPTPTDPSATAGNATRGTTGSMTIADVAGYAADGISSKIMCLNAGGPKAKYFSNANAHAT